MRPPKQFLGTTKF